MYPLARATVLQRYISDRLDFRRVKKADLREEGFAVPKTLVSMARTAQPLWSVTRISPTATAGPSYFKSDWISFRLSVFLAGAAVIWALLPLTLTLTGMPGLRPKNFSHGESQHIYRLLLRITVRRK